MEVSLNGLCIWLPKVKGILSVLVVIDQFSKYVVFSTTPHACSTNTVANLFYHNVVKHFGLSIDKAND